MATAQNLFDKILLRLQSQPPEHDFLTALDMVVRALDRRLLECRSDLIKAENVLPLLAEANEVDLPAGMLAVAEHPVISFTGATRLELLPLPKDKRFSYTEPGVPRYYELRGTKLRVYPIADRDVTVKFESFNPSSVPTLASTVPYNGLFDDTIIELLVRYGASPAIASVDPALDMMTRKAVDDVLRYRSPKNIRFRYPL